MCFGMLGRLVKKFRKKVMKIDWDSAPEWANYAAMDEDGDWFWFENEPRHSRAVWYAEGKCKFIGNPATNWEETLTKRGE